MRTPLPICYLIITPGVDEIMRDVFYENYKRAVKSAHSVGGGAVVTNTSFLASLGAKIEIVERDTSKNRNGKNLRPEFSLAVNRDEARCEQTILSVTFNGRRLKRGV